MIPWLEEELQRYGMSREEILRIFSLAQSMPGMIATNVSTIVGRKLNGFWGSVWATSGVIFPSFVIILVIALGFSSLLYQTSMQGALKAIRATAAIMILFSASSLIKKTLSGKKIPTKLRAMSIVLAIILLSLFTRLNPIIFILTAILTASIEYLIRKKRGSL